MDNQILSQVLAAFAQRRQADEAEENQRLAEIAQKYPDLNALLQARHGMVMRLVQSAFSSGGEANPEAAMAEYNQKIAAALTAKGYPADYLSPIHACAACGDTGYVYEGSVRRMCDCLRRAYLSALSHHALEGDRAMRFDAFDEARFPDAPLPGSDVTQREYMRIVRRKCEDYAAGVPGGEIKTLLLHGGSGLGKTFLLHCVENALRDRGVDALYTTAYDLLTRLRNAYFGRSEADGRDFLDAQCLLIDDLGMEPMWENITVEQLYHLLNARLSRGLYTAVSTNLSRVDLKNRYTERVSSRLLDTRSSLAIPMLGKDIRLIRSENA